MIVGRQPHHHDVVAGRHLLNGGLDVLREPPLGGVQAVDEGRPLLDRMAQASHIYAETICRLADDVPLGELVAERSGQGLTDLDAQTAQILGDGDDTHSAPPGKAKSPRRPRPWPRGLSSGPAKSRWSLMLSFFALVMNPM
jgi:hypothetical protein